MSSPIMSLFKSQDGHAMQSKFGMDKIQESYKLEWLDG